MKFNIDEVAQGKPGPAGIGFVSRDSSGTTILTFFSGPIGVTESNEAEVFAKCRSLPEKGN